MKRIVSTAIVVLFALWFFQRGIRPEKEAGFEFNAFAHLPVKYEGRKKPIDTLARNLLTIVSGKQTVRTDGGRLSAVEWLLDNISGRPEAADYKVIRIENLDVLSSLGLEERKGFRYSYNELMPALGRLDAAYRAAFAKESRDRDLFDRQVIKLGNKLYTFQNVLGAFEDPSTVPPDELLATAQRYMQLENYSLPLAIPPTSGNPRWRPLMSVLLASHPSMQGITGHNVSVDPLGIHFGVMLAAYRDGNAAIFNQQLGQYGSLVQSENPAAFEKISFEVFYNRLSAFMKAAQLYLLVFVLSAFGWLFRKQGLLSAALTLMVVAFIPHTFAIVARSFLSGYPPVTNLYSSAIFIGWGAVLAAIILELGFRKKAAGIGNLVGGIAGFSTLLIAHFLAGDGDTMQQMRAVLDTRFWLATHVITITLGYVATFVAGTIGVFYIVSGLFSRRLDEETEDSMYRMMYGTTCFALLLSFVGTVLGGLWADDSWGRFWGWDPKENGALLIVIWNAIMLHAKYGLMVKHRGFAVMAVFGNVVTAWSWFGVNQLSVGLHSYGFTDSATFALTVFVITQLIFVFAGLLPSKLWKSGQLSES
ncbi:Cytochrome c biogenesis protein CcsA [Pontiella desulfatans]|uniref:Cytochrome c biogenesis protein CcsA n=1 Tax=Pontiella desulfatans TaxID=2750659 RepID=A0A6C2U9R4_PONDE|nr:cytochrome c biogenesis protein CcsA [Pontiella desulfatans]VGO16735.1 Cytochrome c biogenesis protein CcsA [Pontiella desulfatans]